MKRKEAIVIVYRAKVCRDCNTFEDIHLVSLIDEPGFGYETRTGVVIAKGATMAEATERLLQRHENLSEIDSQPYWKQSA